MKPAPTKSSLFRPTEIASAAWMKRASVEAVLRGVAMPEMDTLLCLAYQLDNEETSDLDSEDILTASDFRFVDDSGQTVDPSVCDVILDTDEDVELAVDVDGNVFEVHHMPEVEVRDVDITAVDNIYFPGPTGWTGPASPVSAIALSQAPVSTATNAITPQMTTTAAPRLPTQWPA